MNNKEEEEEVHKDKDGRPYVKLYLDMPLGKPVEMTIPHHLNIGIITAVTIRQGHYVEYGVTWGDMQERFHQPIELQSYTPDKDDE